MKVVLYTPSHNLYFDTLIMYGIILPTMNYYYYKVHELELFEEKSSKLLEKMFEIEFTGKEFVIKSNIGIKDLAVAISSSVNPDVIIGRLTEDVNALQRASARIATQILQKLTNPGNVAQYLDDLTLRFHAIRHNEGRGGKRKVGQKRVWLALSPNLGKFSVSLFKGKDVPYTSCIYCIGLGLLGLFYATMRTRKGRSTLLVFPSFDGIVSGNVLYSYYESTTRKFTELADKLRRGLDNVPERILNLYAYTKLSLDTIKMMREQKATWLSFAVKLVKGATQLRGFNVVKLDALIDALIKTSSINKELIAIIDNLIERSNKGADIASVLNLLFEFFERRDTNTFYEMMRALRSTADRLELLGIESILGVNLAKELARIIE